jgi:Protein of unknown function (DUF1064).
VSKYRAKKTVIDGIMFDSKAEAQYYVELKLLKRSKKIASFECQPEYELIPKFKKNGKTFRAVKYIADFLVTHLDGSEEVVDVKGVLTPVYRLKKTLFESKYPHLTIKEVKR